MNEDEVKAESRVKTGIQGLDVLIEGGFLPGSVILLRGESGTGKTIFGLHFVSFGALQREPGVLVSLSETANDLKRQAACFGWDQDEFENQRMLEMICTQIRLAITPYDLGEAEEQNARAIFQTLYCWDRGLEIGLFK